MNKTIAQLLEQGKQELASQDNPLLESQILLAHALSCDRTRLYTWPEEIVPEDKQAIYLSFITRRQNQEPIAYILGYKEFWSLNFEVTQDTLVPRIETELLVQTVLDNLPAVPSQAILDLGTGCGNIACALAHERKHWQLTAVDLSENALSIAQKNAKAFDIANITFIQSNWFDALKGLQFDAIVGNPPYIREYDLHLRFGDLTFEPRMALTPGKTGFEAFGKILSQIHAHLKPGGFVAFEHGFDQRAGMQDILVQAGFEQIETYRDLAGLDRVTVGRRKH